MPRHIALAGATGNLGLPILTTLLDRNYKVTVLSRIGGSSKKLPSHPNLALKQVDFTSTESLTAALTEASKTTAVEVLVSCVATLAIGSQNPLIDAAVNVGVKRFIPAEFGMDAMNALVRELPVCAPKATTQAYLNEKHRSNPGFTWTGIANGLFLDWCLEMGIILNLKEHEATLYNGGDVRFSVTLLQHIADAVVGVIEKQGETVNRVVYVHSAAVTQNQLVQYAKEKDGAEWDVSVKSTEEVRKESYAHLEKGDADAAMLGFSIAGCCDTEYGCDFSGHLDNQLLGIKELSERELRGVVEGLL